MADVNIKVQIEAAKAQATLSRLAEQTRQAQLRTKRYEEQLKTAELRTKRAALQNDNLRKRLQGVTDVTRRAASTFQIFAGNLAAIGFSRFIGALSQVPGAVLTSTQQLEDLQTQLEVLTGSTETAERAIQDLTSFADRTPFQLSEIAEAQARLLSFGFTVNDSQKLLEDLGDVSAAFGADLGELSLIFGQVSAAGRLTGERLLQLQERAIPIGPALAKTLGVAEESIRDLVRRGEVDFETFRQAFEALNEEGEFAFGGLERRSRTLSGRLSTLRDNFNLLAANIGARFAPALKGAVEGFTTFIQTLSESAAFDQFLNTISNFIPQAILVLVDSFQIAANAVLRVTQFFDLFRSGVTRAFSSVLFVIQEFVRGTSSLFSAIGIDISGAEESITGATTAIINSLNRTADQFSQSSADIGFGIEELNEAIEAGRNVFVKSQEEQAKATEDSQQKQTTAVLNGVQQRTVASTEERNAQSAAAEARKQELEALNQAEADLALAKEERRLLESEQEQIFTDDRLLRLEESFSREQEARIQAQINAAETEQEKQRLILQAQAEGNRRFVGAVQAKARAEQKIEQQKNQALLNGTARLFGSLADAARLGGERFFKVAKALAKAQVIVNTVQAVQQAAASAPFPFNIPAIAAETVRGAVNLARVNSTSPAFQDGGIVPGSSFSGDQVTARVNSGEMILNRRQQENLFRAIDSGNVGGGQGGPIVVNTSVQVDGEEIARAVSNQVANGFQLGEVV